MADINIVISTGAGISADSGIPTYRDVGGLWTKFDPQVVSHIDGWRRTPQKVLDFKNALRRQFVEGQYKPNAAHVALARLQAEWTRGRVTLITQNIDGMHEAAGSRVLAMHGTAATKFCEVCGHESPFDADILLADKCVQCGQGGRTRPSVVMFGEMPKHLDEIDDRLRECDIFVVIGSSLEVSPGNQFVLRVARNRRHAMTMLLNMDQPERHLAHHYRRIVLGSASVEVPKLVAGLLAAQDKATQGEVMEEYESTMEKAGVCKATPQGDLDAVRMLAITSRIQDLGVSATEALAWYRSQPVPGFGGETAEALVKSGRTQAVLEYLDQLADGGYA